jgi:endonuclease/exonuclease/phosphatase family metal-dependent hydrolase
MKVIFWNIGYVPGLNGSLFHYATRGHRLVWSPIKIQKKLLEGVASYVKHETPDLFLYSEISTGTRRNHKLHQHEYLVGQIDGVKTHGATGKYRHLLFYSLPLHGGNANGFLSPHECHTDTVHLKSGGKTLVYVVVVKDVTVVMVHLSLNKKTRAKQLAELSEIVSVVKGPLVVCGDMNIFAGVGELEDFMKATKLTLPKDVPLTHPAHKPKRSLDIFLTRGLKGKVGVRTIETTISDHLPIVLEW